MKLYVENCINVKLEDNHPLWPWLIKYAGQTLHFYQANRHDGLTPVRRVREKSAMSPRAKFGEKVLDKPMTMVKLNKTEPKKRFGAWLVTIEHTGWVPLKES